MGRIIKTQNVKEGRSATPPTPPVYKDSIFINWDTDEYKNVTKNLNVNTIYEIKRFTVIFTIDGTYYSSQTGVAYGTSAIPPYVQPREGYDFVWDDCSNITTDTTVNGQYIKSKNYFEVKFIKSYNSQETVLKSEYVKKGNSATPPSIEEINKAKPTVSQDYYLDGWDKDFSRIVNDTEIRTVYKEKDLTLLLRCASASKAQKGEYTYEYKFNYKDVGETLTITEEKKSNRKYIAPFNTIGSSSGNAVIHTVQAIDNSNKIKTIGKYCFYDSSPTTYVTYVSFPSVTEVKESAFENNDHIINVNMPNLQIIGKKAFYGNKNLRSAIFPKCTTIGDNAFQTCKNISEIDFSNVQKIGELAFANCDSIQSLNLPSLTSVGEKAFQSMDSLTSFTADNLTSINNRDIITAPNLTNFSIANVKTICASAFSSSSYFKNISELKLTKVESIGKRALIQFCYITKIVLNASYKDSLIESMNNSGMWGIGTQKKNIWYNKAKQEISVSWE